MTEQAAASPHSQPDSNGPKLCAPKVRSCPFCHQAFTSSSLGRHLDQYVKARNPKAPDGVHNIDRIREIRAGITRRQARSASAKKENTTSTPTSLKRPFAEEPASPSVPQSPTFSATRQDPAGHKPAIKLNALSWHATGVINDLPARPTATAFAEPRRDASRHYSLKLDVEQTQKVQAELEDGKAADVALEYGKAAEMALKEVLESVREASARTASLDIFDFDPLKLNFPGLCLRILPPPSTLFSPTPFPTSESWSIDPPGQKQLDALERAVRERLPASIVPSKRPANTRPHWSSPTAASPLPTPPLEPTPEKLFSHLVDAHDHWKGLGEKQKQEAWHVELLRSYASADEGRREAESCLCRARCEIDNLKDQLEKMRNGWIGLDSEGMNQHTSSSANVNGAGMPLHISRDAMQEIAKQGSDVRNWDFDYLIEKWKAVVRNEKQSTNGLSSRRSLTNPSQPLHRNSTPITIPSNRFASTASTVNSAGPSRTFSTSTSVVHSSAMDEDPRLDTLNGDGNSSDDNADADAEGEADADQDRDPTQPQQPPPHPASPQPQHRPEQQPYAQTQILPPLGQRQHQIPSTQQQQQQQQQEEQQLHQQAPHWLRQQRQKIDGAHAPSYAMHVGAATPYPYHGAMEGVEGPAAAFIGQGMGLGLSMGMDEGRGAIR